MTSILSNISERTQYLSNTSKCITAFTNYINEKANTNKKLPKPLRTTTEVNVFQNLITLMTYKGFVNLTPARVMDFARRIGSDLDYNRDKLFKEIAFWAGIPLPILTPSEQKKSAQSARKDLTLTDTLERMTVQLSGPVLYSCTNFSNCPATARTYTSKSPEVKWMSTLRKEKVTGLKSKVCAQCWICGDDIHVYEISTAAGTKHTKCGEDEHVLPPGVGNIFGLLYPTVYETVERQSQGIVQKSLRPSHQWCNRVKSGMILVLGPDPTDQTYRINEPAMTKMLAKAKNWLSNKENVRLEPDYSFHNKNTTQITTFTAQMNHSMRILLSGLCDDLNDTVLSGVSNFINGKRQEWTMYLLRLVFNCCIIGFTVIFSDNAKFRSKWRKHGGGGQNGGQIGGTLGSDELNELANFMVNQPNICLTEDALLADDNEGIEPASLPTWRKIMNNCTSCIIDNKRGAVGAVAGCCIASQLGLTYPVIAATGVATGVAAEYIVPKPQIMERGGKNNKNNKKYYMKTKKQRKSRKGRKSKKYRGGNKIGGNNIGSNCNDPNFSIYNTNMLKLFPYKGGSAIPPESNQNLLRTQEGIEIEQLTEEQRQQRLEEEEERQRLEDIRRQEIQDAFINGQPVNLNDSDDSFNSDMSELRLSDLGGGSKVKKGKKSRKSKNSRKGRKSKKGRKSRKSKGGNLYLADPYKNNEGPQY
jgi:hypothetical protein